MSSANNIVRHAVEVLRRGRQLTLDAVASEAGLTKPGVLHYFTNKDALTVAVVDHIIDVWEQHLQARAIGDQTSLGKLRSYVDWALSGDFDASDLVLFADIRLRNKLCARWVGRLDCWLGGGFEGSVAWRANLRAARLLADGAWINSALGISTFREDERESLHGIALSLIKEEDFDVRFEPYNVR